MFIKLIAFDLDGTLADTGADLANSVNLTLSSLGIPGRPDKEILGFVGDGVAKLIERALGSRDADRFEEALIRFKEIYAGHLLDQTTLYPGVMDTLLHLSPVAKAIVTNKSMAFTRTICKGLGIEHFFLDTITGDRPECLKPDARLLQSLLKKTGVDAAETLVVGDGVNDILLARNAGAKSCAFLNGLGKRETLLGLQPDFAIERMEELKDIVCWTRC